MSGSLESVRWNACEHRLDLGLRSDRKEFGENGVRTHVDSKGKKIPFTGNSSRRRIEPTTQHQAGQRAQHTTNELLRPKSEIDCSEARRQLVADPTVGRAYQESSLQLKTNSTEQ